VTSFSTKNNDDGTKTTVTTLNDDGEESTKSPIKISSDDTSDSSDTTSSSTSGDTVDEDTVDFAITSLTDDTLTTSKGYHLIQGTTPSSTSKITVNGYALSKYKASETKWSYIAATSLGTLKKGTNYYTVSALDSQGNKIATKNFTIVYNGTSNGSLASTGSSTSLMISLALAILAPLAFLYFRRPAFSKIAKK